MFYPIQLKIKIENTTIQTVYPKCLPYTTKDKDKNTNYANASHKYCTCAERNIVSQQLAGNSTREQYREALASKTLDPELKRVLETSIKMVNYIKARPLNIRLFATLCNELGSKHECFLFHTEVRWLSRGNVLSHLFELAGRSALISDVAWVPAR